jgi:hypothetical protein
MFLDPVPESEEKGRLWQKVLAVAIYLLFWIVLSGIGLWLMFAMRTMIFDLMVAANFTPWMVRGFDRWAIFVLGLIWFISMLWIEHYLRTGISKKRLWRNIGRVLVVQALLAAITFGTRFIIAL